MIETIETIVRSPLLEVYNIGITMDPKRRKAQYKNWVPTWPHFVVLRQGMTLTRALQWERALFLEVQSRRGSILYKKYRSDSRDKPHRPSAGGRKDDGNKDWVLYLAWGNKGDN